jgi:hypothetical protein
MSSEDEVREALEGKKLKEITLPKNSNDLDQGSDSSNAKEKIGEKSSLARVLYLMERDKKMQYGDKQAIVEYMQDATEIRQRLEQQKQRQPLEYDLIQEEKKRLAKEAKITPLDRENEQKDIEKLERKREKEIANIQDYFNASEEEWEEYINDNHKAEESLAHYINTKRLSNPPIMNGH